MAQLQWIIHCPQFRIKNVSNNSNRSQSNILDLLPFSKLYPIRRIQKEANPSCPLDTETCLKIVVDLVYQNNPQNFEVVKHLLYKGALEDML